MNSSGKSNYEFLTVAVVCLILASIVLGIALNNVRNERFRVFRYNAKIVGINAINYEASNSEDVVYLYELINDNLIKEVKNSFSGDESCDLYASKVEFVDDKKMVTLQCGNYLIYKQDITDKNYDIYKVDDWSFEKKDGKDIDTIDVYSLNKNGKDLLNGFYEEDLFVKLVASNYGDEYNSLEKIEKDFDVKSKKAYRKRVLIN